MKSSSETNVIMTRCLSIENNSAINACILFDVSGNRVLDLHHRADRWQRENNVEAQLSVPSNAFSASGSKTSGTASSSAASLAFSWILIVSPDWLLFSVNPEQRFRLIKIISIFQNPVFCNVVTQIQLLTPLGVFFMCMDDQLLNHQIETTICQALRRTANCCTVQLDLVIRERRVILDLPVLTGSPINDLECQLTMMLQNRHCVTETID